MLAVIETHPIQYHAPVYRALAQEFEVPVTAIYGSDFSLRGYWDDEFATNLAWDADLLQGYESLFLSRVLDRDPASATKVRPRGLAQVLARVAPKAVLLVGYRPRFHLHAFAAARRAGKPSLFRAETTDHARLRNGLENRLRDCFLRWFYGRCAALLPVGKRSQAHFERLGFTRNLFFSPYCVDTSPFRTDERARTELRSATRNELGLSSSQFVIGFSGKLSPRKAPDLLLAAMRLLPSPLRTRSALLLVGDGELRIPLAAEAARLPAIAVRQVGFQVQGALSRFYHAMDVLVLPSRHSETWGLVVNEALHHGLPAVVSQAVGCAPDLIEPGRTGEVFPTDSAVGLAQMLKRMALLVEDERVRANCRARAQQYSLARAAQGIAEAYHAVRDSASPTGNPLRSPLPL